MPDNFHEQRSDLLAKMGSGRSNGCVVPYLGEYKGFGHKDLTAI